MATYLTDHSKLGCCYGKWNWNENEHPEISFAIYNKQMAVCLENTVFQITKHGFGNYLLMKYEVRLSILTLKEKCFFIYICANSQFYWFF